MLRLIITGCVLLASLTNCVQAVKTVKIHPNCPEIPATTFEKVGLDAKAGALQFGKLVTVGEFSVKTDPQIISGISQSVRDDQVTDALVCAARERGELKTSEQIDHAWKVARFYRLNPTADKAIEFHKQNPFPVSSGKHLSDADSQQIAMIRQVVMEGYALKKDIEREYRSQRQQKTFEANEGTLIKDWEKQFGDWKVKARNALHSIDPLLVERFNTVRAGIGSTPNENSHWDVLDRNFNAKIDFLNRRLDAISENEPRQKSEDIAELKNHIASTITGGDSFAYIIPVFQSANASPILTVVHRGEYPLYDLSVRIVDLAKLGGKAPSLSEMKSSVIGNLSPNHAAPIGNVQINGESLRWNLFFSARNGFFTELLRVQRVGNEWKTALKVMNRPTADEEVKTLFERIDQDYPLGKDAMVEW